MADKQHFQIDGCTFIHENVQGLHNIAREIWQDNAYRYTPEPNQIVVDAGANVGLFTVWAAMHGALVYAYEPCRASYEDLLRNVVLNHVEGRVFAHNFGLWSVTDRLTLWHLDSDSGGHSLLEPSRKHGEDVLCVNVDDALRTLRRIDFLKLDTEGAEYEILQYASPETLKKIQAFAVEWHGPAMGPNFQQDETHRYDRIRGRLDFLFELEELKTPQGWVNYTFGRRK
jgi:FkbM family methyltransferase